MNKLADLRHNRWRCAQILSERVRAREGREHWQITEDEEDRRRLREIHSQIAHEEETELRLVREMRERALRDLQMEKLRLEIAALKRRGDAR